MKPVTSNRHLKFHYSLTPNPGLEALWAVDVKEGIMPLGYIWYQQILVDHTDLVYVWVHERCRRQRIASQMLVELISWYPTNTVATAVANKLSAPWLRAMGFVQEPGGWFLRPRKIEPCPMI